MVTIIESSKTSIANLSNGIATFTQWIPPMEVGMEVALTNQPTFRTPRVIWGRVPASLVSATISIPNEKKLKSISWSKDHGYIACGGEDGLLKVLKLEVQGESKSKGLAAQTNLVMNQTLEGHTGYVQVITWNEKFKKITTSDQQGLIIVWMLYKGAWYEEMINNRNKSVVSSMKWDTDGHRICIVYEDGAVIVGSVDGNRIWGKELTCGNLLAVEWSPDSALLLFGLITGEVLVYDYAGNYLSKVSIYCLNNIHGAVRLVGLHWYNGGKGLVEPNCPTLAVCYDIGRCQLMRHHGDTATEVPKYTMEPQLSQGIQPVVSQSRSRVKTHVYFPVIQHLRSLCLPGKSLTSCAWEGSGSLRLALTVDSFIYFANLRPDYKWAYCNAANTIIYSFARAGSQATFVVFWNVKRNLTRMISVNQLTHICAAEDYACLVCKNDPAGSGSTLTLCNAMGISLNSKRIQLEPTQVLMTGNQVIAVTKSLIYAWQFANPKQLTGLTSGLSSFGRAHREGFERLCHIDNQNQKLSEVSGEETLLQDRMIDWTLARKPASPDPVSTIAVSGRRHLFVARLSGIVNHYRLPDLHLESTFQATDTRPYRMQVNCDASKLAIVDDSGVLTMHLTTDGTPNGGALLEDRQKLNDFVRKDVWDIRFSEDNPDMFAIMEKTRMFIFDRLQAEPAIQTSTFICSFHNLEVLGVLLDELVALEDQPSKDCLLRVPVKVFRDCQYVLEKEGPTKAQELLDANPHPKLKQLLAESCLARQDLDTAELGFVHCQNYAGIQFVKRLRNVQSKVIRKAEVDAFFGKIDEAEQLLLTNDRSDLAIELRKRFGDWFRVAQLAKDSGALVKDAELAEIWNCIGDHFADQMLWDKAAGYYRQGGDLTKFAECLYQLEDYNGLERLVEELQDNHPLLPELAHRLADIGLAQQAVYALIKCNRVQEAIDVHLELNNWQLALDLINQHIPITAGMGNYHKQQQQQKIDSLLNQNIAHLLDQGRRVHAVELFKRAGKFLPAAELMYQEARDAARKGTTSLLQLKKMYVVIGLLMEQYYEQNKLQASAKAKITNCAESVMQASSTLAGLLLEERERTEHQVDQLTTNTETNKSIWNEALGRSRKPDAGDRPTDNSSSSLERTPDKFSTGIGGRAQVSEAGTPFVNNRRADISRLIDQPWRGAEAYHFLSLAQRQLYAGSIDEALRTAQLLRDYEDILEPRTIYSLIAMCAIYAKAFGVCSKAFTKLETLPNLSSADRKAYERLALDIFTMYQPSDQHRNPDSYEMDSMLESETKIPICVVTGQPVTDYQFWMCPTCKHSAYEQEITRLHSCPLCHFPVQ
ncbi:WD domain, G-beta repeat protein [Opisthorchis viverrini]|uniref:WD domain, G-beta repeat protein n=1 Tax=Opisthorchis viverrini TaxID=6198 RepID=A0A1S8X4C7_OPIVI|nr:WD domain, G-beta repeat protein [Opisthorchis viverrini]